MKLQILTVEVCDRAAGSMLLQMLHPPPRGLAFLFAFSVSYWNIALYTVDTRGNRKKQK
jgi:hypothetical protein